MKRIEAQSHTQGARADSYWDDQVSRHALKAQSRRDIKEYQGVASLLLAGRHAPEGSRMICLGTRNNHERDRFRELLPGVNVVSLDISPASEADFIMDFTQLPTDWADHWDIVYSNSLDHSFDATDTFDKWLRVIRPGGILALGVGYDAATSQSDICSFTEVGVVSFIDARPDIALVGRASHEYETFILQKIR